MFSVKDDLVLDPFLGTGTTMYAAMATGRNSVGYEIDKNFKDVITSQINGIVDFLNNRIKNRLEDHLNFVQSQNERVGKLKYVNKHYQFPVMTNQETQLIINQLHSVKKFGDNIFKAVYSDEPQKEFIGRAAGIDETSKR